MPSEFIPCVHCKKPIKMAKSIVKKHKIEVFLCDNCAKKVQNKFLKKYRHLSNKEFWKDMTRHASKAR